jgi:hypothetical protein
LRVFVDVVEQDARLVGATLEVANDVGSHAYAWIAADRRGLCGLIFDNARFHIEL